MNNRRSTKLSPRQLRRILLISLLVILAVAGLITYLRGRVQNQLAKENAGDIRTAQTRRGSISSWVYGSGSLSDEDVKKLTLPKGVELEEILVTPGEGVQEGQLLASVNISSVMSAMKTLDGELSRIDKEIAALKADSGIRLISASVSGRVKEIYAAVGQDVAAVMEQHGALMLISLDGYMAVDLENSALQAGEKVLVLDSSGGSYPCTVEKNTDGTATVLVPDGNAMSGEAVTVHSADGSTKLGSGSLYIHAPLRVMGTVGTVEHLYTRSNAQILSGSSLLSISGSGAAVEYESLLRQRGEIEADYAALARIYRQGGLHSPITGTVREIQATEVTPRSKVTGDNSTDTPTTSVVGVNTTATASATANTAAETQEYFTFSPDRSMLLSVNVDESQILTLSLGQKAGVTVDAIENQSFEGTVTGIDRVGSSSSGVTTYTAEITVDKAPGMLSGMSASATISIEGVDDALLLPIDALNRTGSGYFVYTSYDAASDQLGGMVEVTVGLTNSNSAQLLSGIGEGVTVYYRPKQLSFYDMMMGGGDFGGHPGGNFVGPGGEAPRG